MTFINFLYFAVGCWLGWFLDQLLLTLFLKSSVRSGKHVGGSNEVV